MRIASPLSVLLLLASASAGAQSKAPYLIHDLDPGRSSGDSHAVAVTDAGDVVVFVADFGAEAIEVVRRHGRERIELGFSQLGVTGAVTNQAGELLILGQFDPVPGRTESFLYNVDTRALTTLAFPDASYTRPRGLAIDPDGEPIVVGAYTLGNAGHQAFIWRPSASPAYRELCLPSGCGISQTWGNVEPSAVNGFGDAVGSAQYGRSVVWRAGETPAWLDVELQGFGVSSVEAKAINDAGQITGNVWGAVGMGAFLYHLGEGRFEALGSLAPGRTASATAISQNGIVTGYGDNADGARRAFIWNRQTGMRELPALPRGTYNMGVSVNVRGQVAGRATPSTGNWHAAIWQTGPMNAPK